MPPLEEWNGEDGTVSKIVRASSHGEDQRRRVKEVIADYHFTILVGGEYNLQRKSRTTTTAIKDKSHIQQLVCNHIKSGVNLTEAQLLVNIWCIKHGEGTVTCSTVYSCVQRMKKRVSLIKKHPQGHTDPKSDCACCQFCLAAQMLLRFGEDLSEHQHQHLLIKLLGETGDLPPCFDSALHPTLDINGIVFYDVR